MGFTFLGETRHGEHWVIADVRIKNLDKSVRRSTNLFEFGSDRAHHMQYWHMWGDFQNTL